MIGPRHLLRLAAAALASGLAAGLPAAAAAQECGSPGAPCEIERGGYHIRLPDPATPTIGMVLWLHGYGGSGGAEIANDGLGDPITTAGYAFVAPDGIAMPSEGIETDWGVADGFEWPRNDIAFLDAVIEDVAARFGVPTDRVIISGFSRGGSMAWDFACARPDAILGAAPVAGGFWEPMTKHCEGPVNLFHTHGFSDRTVPLEGRKAVFGSFEYHQGNILKGLDVWREADGCMGAADISLTAPGDWEKRWTSCKAGSIILWIHPGDHMIPPGWVERMLDWAGGLD